eukprot:7642240-Pyramimonas_sp.AAC.1
MCDIGSFERPNCSVACVAAAQCTALHACGRPLVESRIPPWTTSRLAPWALWMPRTKQNAREGRGKV